jgi:hypothetical protein
MDVKALSDEPTWRRVEQVAMESASEDVVEAP